MFDLQTLDHNVEVINAGISGGNSSTELQLIKSKSQGSNDVTLNDDFQGIENGNFVLSLSSRSYISVSLSTHTMPDKFFLCLIILGLLTC